MIEVRVLWYQIMLTFGLLIMVVVMDIKNGRTILVIHGHLHLVTMEKSVLLVYNCRGKPQERPMKAGLS